MRIDFYGLAFETPRVTFYLRSPWRASALEHRLFEAVKVLPNARYEEYADEWLAHVVDPRTWRGALTALARVLKGWQEEADPGSEKRSWRWLMEADTDSDGYDHAGEPACLWAFLRVALDRGSPEEPEKGEDIDLEGFGVQIWPANE
ncbi:MAG: hypothetical protein L0Z62_30375 [Gemmataceae bacterium]|nr:hypothetical protein [Gemmataceae bacterium]